MEDISTNICIGMQAFAFNVSCFANHMRESGNCPLCRSKVVEKPKKAEKCQMSQLSKYHAPSNGFISRK